MNLTQLLLTSNAVNFDIDGILFKVNLLMGILILIVFSFIFFYIKHHKYKFQREILAHNQLIENRKLPHWCLRCDKPSKAVDKEHQGVFKFPECPNCDK